MDNLLVPRSPEFGKLERRHRDFHLQDFRKKRSALMGELSGVEPLCRVARGLNRRAVYTIELAPKGATLFKDGYGNVKAVWYKNGKIVQQARLRRVRLNVFRAASVAGSQILLVNIGMQLHEIREALKGIRADLHNDRMAEIESGRNLFEQAILLEKPDNRARALHNAIQTLNSGVAKTTRSLGVQIAELPIPGNSFWDNWGRSKARQAAESIRQAEESYRYALLGIGLLAQAYSALGEQIAAASCIGDLLAGVRNAGIDHAVEKARLVPYDGRKLPEHVWQRFAEFEPLAQRQLQLLGTGADKMPLVQVEVCPAELEVS